MNVLDRLSATLERLLQGERLLVAIDGPDAAGKSMLANQLCQMLDRPALGVSIDSWHHPREFRMRRGDESPEGYFHDSFDLETLVVEMLTPFRSGATTVRSACYDYVSDRPVKVEAGVAANSVLIFEGVFLLRRELQPVWDLTIYLHVSEAVTLQRAVDRDRALLGGETAVRRRYEKRYLPGQRLYRQTVSPLDVADIVIDNSTPAHPRILRWSGAP